MPRGGFAALYPRRRSDADKPRASSEELGQLILRLKQEKPRRSVKRIIRILEGARGAASNGGPRLGDAP